MREEISMIYTITLNPSLDYIMHVDLLCEGQVNRSHGESFVAGGKGINVSAMLHTLGIPSVALGFVAGFTGKELCARVQACGVREDFITLSSGMTRINVKLKGGEETEINGAGPCVSDGELGALIQKTETLTSSDTLVLSGSIPPSVRTDIYAVLAERAARRGARIVADLSGKHLFNVLPYRPFLIKPNKEELAALFDVTLTGREDVIAYACRLRDMGAQNVLVSMAGEGAILAAEDGAAYCSSAAAGGPVVNSVGAGDSMVAGFLAGYQQGSLASALRLGAAAGSATAFSEGIADNAQSIFALAETVEIHCENLSPSR